MNNETLNELQSRSIADLESREMPSRRNDLIRKLETQSAIYAEIEKMKQEGKTLLLSDEEIDLLRNFRRFRLRMRKRIEVFTWQTRRPEGVQLAEETAEILHPNEASCVESV